MKKTLKQRKIETKQKIKCFKKMISNYIIMGSFFSYETPQQIQETKCSNHVWGYRGNFGSQEWIRKCNNCDHSEKTTLTSAFDVKGDLEKDLEFSDPVIQKIY